MGSVRVKMTKTAAGPEGNFLSGHKYLMDEKLAKAFKKDDACEILGSEKESSEKGEGSGSVDTGEEGKAGKGNDKK